MAAQQPGKLNYDTLLGMLPFVMDFLDIDSEDVIASGILDDDRLDDAVIAMIMSYKKCQNKQNGDIESETESDNLAKNTNASSSYGHKPAENYFALQEYDFRAKFRMNEKVLEALLQDLQNLTAFSGKLSDVATATASQQTISAVFRLKLTLQFLGSQHSMEQLAIASQIPETLCSNIIHDTMESLCELMQYYIIWPAENQIASICESFKDKSTLPGVVGTIDVLHVPVKAAADQKHFYLNSDNETTVVLQTVCDHRLHFLHCSTGWPGSTQEMKVLKLSDLYHDVQDQDELEAHFPFDSYLVGDEAYDLQSWLITPFAESSQLSTLQQQFNSACHVVLQNNTLAYTLLMQRFPRLECVEMKDMQSTVVTILVCCALHNFCLDNGDHELVELKDMHVSIRNINTQPSLVDAVSSEDSDGENKRQHVLQQMQEL